MILRLAGWVVAGLAIVASAGIAAARPFGYDLAVYLDAAHRLATGAPLYPLAARAAVVWTAGEYLYPPTTAAAFIPLALLPRDLATAIWTALLVAVAALIAVELLRPLGRGLRPWALAAYVLYLPLVAEVTLGNLTLVTLGLCLLAWRWRQRAAIGGASLAVAVGAKLLPLALPFYFLAAGTWRLLVAAVIVAAAVTAVTLPWLGSAWQTYAEMLSRLAGAPAEQATTLVPSALMPVRLVLPALAVAVAIFAGLRARDPRSGRSAYVTALAAVPLAAPGIWYPYLVFELPLLAHVLRDPRLWTRVGLVVSFACLEIPKQPESPDIAFAGLLILISIGVARIARPTQRQIGEAMA